MFNNSWRGGGGYSKKTTHCDNLSFMNHWMFIVYFIKDEFGDFIKTINKISILPLGQFLRGLQDFFN